MIWTPKQTLVAPLGKLMMFAAYNVPLISSPIQVTNGIPDLLFFSPVSVDDVI